ncbi:hypothetical protein [Pelagerythrobacter sp.]|uniref:hypothetical protein n=1 Tax=Pelagerythrobacter sp. TaxID=2800702 RepID=UPI0035B280B8
MLKKLLFVAAAVIGLIYGSGSDLASVKRAMLGAANDNARGFTPADDGGWGSGSTY